MPSLFSFIQLTSDVRVAWASYRRLSISSLSPAAKDDRIISNDGKKASQVLPLQIGGGGQVLAMLKGGWAISVEIVLTLDTYFFCHSERGGGGRTTLFGHTFLSLFIAPPPTLPKLMIGPLLHLIIVSHSLGSSIIIYRCG